MLGGSIITQFEALLSIFLSLKTIIFRAFFTVKPLFFNETMTLYYNLLSAANLLFYIELLFFDFW